MLRRSAAKGSTEPDSTMTENVSAEQPETIAEPGDVIHIHKWKFNTVILSTHINIMLYATCFWIQIGTMPYLSKKLGADPVIFGYLQTTFAVVQLAGGPLFGRFGDQFGGRAAMTLAFSSAALSYLLLGMATNIPMLFLSRLPSVFMHAMQGGQMIVTDIGDEKMRADGLGKLGLSYGVGMVIGPLIGGTLTRQFSEQLAANVAFVGSLISILIVLKFVPSQTKKARICKEQETSESSIFNVKKLMAVISAPGALFLLLVKTGGGIPIGIFQSMFAIIAMEKFQLPADQNGYMMSYIGILSMMVQGLGLGVLIKVFSENTLLKWSCFLLVWSYLLLSYVTTIFQLCLVMAPLVCGLSSKNIIISSALTKTVAEADTGAMLGINMAVNSLIRTVSPTIGGYMLQNYGFPSFGYFGFAVMSVVTTVVFIKLRN